MENMEVLANIGFMFYMSNQQQYLNSIISTCFEGLNRTNEKKDLFLSDLSNFEKYINEIIKTDDCNLTIELSKTANTHLGQFLGFSYISILDGIHSIPHNQENLNCLIRQFTKYIVNPLKELIQNHNHPYSSDILKEIINKKESIVS